MRRHIPDLDLEDSTIKNDNDSAGRRVDSLAGFVLNISVWARFYSVRVGCESSITESATPDKPPTLTPAFDRLDRLQSPLWGDDVEILSYCSYSFTL